MNSDDHFDKADKPAKISKIGLISTFSAGAAIALFGSAMIENEKPQTIQDPLESASNLIKEDNGLDIDMSRNEQRMLQDMQRLKNQVNAQAKKLGEGDQLIIDLRASLTAYENEADEVISVLETEVETCSSDLASFVPVFPKELYQDQCVTASTGGRSSHLVSEGNYMVGMTINGYNDQTTSWGHENLIKEISLINDDSSETTFASRHSAVTNEKYNWKSPSNSKITSLTVFKGYFSPRSWDNAIYGFKMCDSEGECSDKLGQDLESKTPVEFSKEGCYLIGFDIKSGSLLDEVCPLFECDTFTKKNNEN